MQNIHLSVWHGGVLFGYTHGVKTDLEITAAAAALGASFHIYPKERSISDQLTVKPKKQRKRVFEQYVLAPSFALSTVFLGLQPDLYIIMGHSLNLDMIFTKEKSGISFLSIYSFRFIQ